ncbi:hypothetical protein IQ241_17970 [Romeria aff. gracilis LEGE 07310]|uniref:Uncharacterized protein n=1 Tax=Vasconcelosia minhoensis LEGE 07310 TaxID=915328 RepID=A0A8J7DDU4_9CYAN|nr:hypothetical protein [Romeria gracilis]MBE9079163.1 hypothetical protein [Romeria aff. gracilis LEGE 07310]
MNIGWDKLMHFITGLGTGIVFWWVLERYARLGSRLINPIAFLIMLIWGASGLFFFRKLGVPLLSYTYFYMAFPDWDIPLYQWLGWRLLRHRSWLFHSALIPMGGFALWLWIAQITALTQLQRALNNLLRDCAMGLSVGICAHLLWDALLSSTKRVFFVHGFNAPSSYLWLLFNCTIGLGVPLLIAKGLQPGSNYR